MLNATAIFATPLDQVTWMHLLSESGEASHASITRLTGRVKELESKADQPTTVKVARRLKEKLESLDSEFKVHHLAVVDAINVADDAALRKEQNVLDKHDDEISALTVCLQKLIAI